MRAVVPGDAEPARALVLRQFGGTRYEARLLELLASALVGADDRGVLALASGSPVGIALYGDVAGTAGTLKIHLVSAVQPGALRVLLAKALRTPARLVVAEVPEDDHFAPMDAILAAAGFRVDGRVDDWVADGVGMRLLSLRTR